MGPYGGKYGQHSVEWATQHPLWVRAVRRVHKPPSAISPRFSEAGVMGAKRFLEVTLFKARQGDSGRWAPGCLTVPCSFSLNLTPEKWQRTGLAPARFRTNSDLMNTPCCDHLCSRRPVLIGLRTSTLISEISP